MADPAQLPVDTPEHDDAHNSDRGTDGGGHHPPPAPPQDPADPLSEAQLKSLAEHVARFLAGLQSSGGLSSSGK